MAYRDGHTNIAVWLTKDQRAMVENVVSTRDENRSEFLRLAIKNQLRSVLQGKIRKSDGIRRQFVEIWGE